MQDKRSLRQLAIEHYRKKPNVFDVLEIARDKRSRRSPPDPISFEEMRSFLEANRDLCKLDEILTSFNVFVALNATDYETRHSNFLAWLLNPSQPHGFGAAFLTEFLRRAARNANEQAVPLPGIEKVDLGKLGAARIVREKLQRIDVTVLDDISRFICVIENKIHTGEHTGQLGRYREAIAASYPDYTAMFVFLTLKDEKPSDPAYIGMTYREVGELLGSVAGKQPDLAPPDAEACLFRHYIDFVRARRSSAEPIANVSNRFDCGKLSIPIFGRGCSIHEPIMVLEWNRCVISSCSHSPAIQATRARLRGRGRFRRMRSTTWKWPAN